MAAALLAVKFYIPKPRPLLTGRTQLLDRFSSGLALPLTLISAPAGFGKSTLLAAWVDRQTNIPGSDDRFGNIAWLSLDSADNRPPRFWTYVVAAIQTGMKGLGASNASPAELALDAVLETLQSDPPPAIEPILDQLINVITAFPGRILLVLDDYHEIQSAQIHEQMVYLLDHQPPNLHLIISTRVDPPLPVARLRVRGGLSEFRAADLRFNQTETTHFFKIMTHVELAEEDVAAIQASTEGWIAGLQMAALALQAQFSPLNSLHWEDGKVHEFVQSFSGKNTYVLDYLADEVFNRQPEPVQSFLLRTSVLERFCAPLCDQITGPVELATDAAQPAETTPSSSQEILAYLEKTNLFLIPLDSERQWFRYHHLFADLLRVRLEQIRPGLKTELHRRASEWYEHNGLIDEGIHHAALGQDWERAAGLMEHEIPAFIEKGQLSRLMDWVALLPREVSTRRIELLFQQSYVMGLAHRMKEFVPLLAAEEQALEELERSPQASREQTNRLRCNLYFQKGYYLISQNDPQAAKQLAIEGIGILPPGCALEESWLYWVRAYADRSLSHLPEAVEGFQEAFRVTQAHGNLWTDMVCLTDLAMVYHLLGELKKACEVYLRAIDLGKQRGASAHSYLNRVEAWLCLVLIERNELTAAEQHAKAALEYSQYWPSTNTRSVTDIVLAQLEMAKGDLSRAGEWMALAEGERQKSPLMPVNHSLLDYNLVRYWLAVKDFSTARAWAQPFREAWKSLDPEAVLAETVEVQWIALARVLIASGDSGLEEAINLLDRIERSARASGRVNSLVEAGVLKAVALQSSDHHRKNTGAVDPEALRALEMSLTVGEPGGYVRVFVDEGEAMADLLMEIRQWYSRGSNPAFGFDYLDHILCAFPNHTGDHNRKSGLSIPEPLTDREMDVLRLMASGLSNKELAERLVLSEGTIKTHIHNLMGKLEAQSRTQAIARARELSIL